jgi:dipeptidyl aminopeptidase/acylaminoacyl peptidase
LLLFFLTCCPGLALAAPPSLEELLRLPQYLNPVLSDNGQYLAVGIPKNGHMNLAVVDLGSRKATLLTAYDDTDVVSYRWIGSERILWSIGQINAPGSSLSRLDSGGLFSATREGKELRIIFPSLRGSIMSPVFSRGGRYLAPVRGSQTEILVETNQRSAESLDVYRLDVQTGRYTLLTFDRPDHVYRWVLDRNDVPRVAVSYVRDELTRIVSYRAAPDAPWVELSRRERASDVIYPVRFDDDNETLIVASNLGRDTMALYRYDPRTRSRGDLLVQHPRFDLVVDELESPRGVLRIDAKTRSLVGLDVVTARPETVWFDEGHARLQQTVDTALPETRNIVSSVPDSNRHLVTAYSDRRSPRWYLFDEDKRSLEELFGSRSWLAPEQMAEMKPVVYRTRDGFEQLAYLLLPASRKPGERLPMVIHIHGGPWVAGDEWGFMNSFGVAEAQVLASQGYAVLLPHFRGTTGHGVRQFLASARQVGKAMQEDIEDAGDWAVQEGYADANRICLSGASYGGYASLMGVAKTPDKYRCAVAGLAVTDWELLLTSSWGDTYYSDAGLKFLAAMLGNAQKDREALRAVSPVYLADRIKVPVLIYAGSDDVRVPLEQMKSMRAALAKYGRSVVWIQKDEEQHGYASVENRLDLYRQVIDFLDRAIGPHSAVR